VTPAQITALAQDIDFAIDITEPRETRLRRFEDAIRAALPPPADPPGLVELVREWQEARRPVGLSAPGVGVAETYQAAVKRMAAADAALAAFDLDATEDDETETCETCQQPITGQVVRSWDDVPLCEECAEPDRHAPADNLDGPAGGALVGRSAPTESTGILIGDVVLVGGHVEPPQFQIVTTDHERGRWQTRREEVMAVFRPVWRKGRHAESTDVSWMPCACTCGCVEVATRDGRCDTCRLRESCRGLRTCEACAAGYRLASDGIHYDQNDSTWGVCRKITASIKFGAGLRPWP
jgi:hypothetical protein